MRIKMSKALRNKIEAAKEADEFWMDSAKLDFALALENRRRQSGKSYSDVAISMKTSPAYISKVFRGDANLTIESMVKLARNLGCHLDVKLNKVAQKDESLQSLFDSVKPAVNMNRKAFDAFIAEEDAGKIGRFNLPEAFSQQSSDDQLYQNAA